MMKKRQYLGIPQRAVGCIMGLCIAATSLNAVAADTYQYGTINNITSTTSGLMLMLDSGVPTNCTGTPYGWMLIPEANKTMVATTLMTWANGNRQVTVYTNAVAPGNFCIINQVDPH